MTAPRHDTAGLVARIRAGQAEIDALDARRAKRAAEVKRLILQLAKLPSEVPEDTPAPARTWVPLKAAAQDAKKSVDTLRRHGKPAGWVWKQGGRLVVDPVALDAWMSGPQA